jgi:hypothetical protein
MRKEGEEEDPEEAKRCVSNTSVIVYGAERVLYRKRDALWASFQSSVNSAPAQPAAATPINMVKVVKKYLFAGKDIECAHLLSLILVYLSLTHLCIVQRGN